MNYGTLIRNEDAAGRSSSKVLETSNSFNTTLKNESRASSKPIPTPVKESLDETNAAKIRLILVNAQPLRDHYSDVVLANQNVNVESSQNPSVLSSTA